MHQESCHPCFGVLILGAMMLWCRDTLVLRCVDVVVLWCQIYLALVATDFGDALMLWYFGVKYTLLWWQLTSVCFFADACRNCCSCAYHLGMSYSFRPPLCWHPQLIVVQITSIPLFAHAASLFSAQAASLFLLLLHAGGIICLSLLRQHPFLLLLRTGGRPQGPDGLLPGCAAAGQGRPPGVVRVCVCVCVCVCVDT